MKKHIALFLIFCMFISCAAVMISSAWADGPEIVNTGSSSYDFGYEPEMAFDNNPITMWHTQWNDYGEGGVAHNIFPQSLIVELDDIYWIDCIGYLARQNGFNGTAYEYEVWVSTTGSVKDVNTDERWIQVANGTWSEDFWNEWRIDELINDGGEFVNVEFDAIEAKLVKFKILDGVGGWASVAALEIGFLGVDYTPMSGFTPRSAPGTPAPVAESVETVELMPEAAPVSIAVLTPSDNMIIIFVIISMAGVFAYRKIAVSKLS